jgi:hypothetical protein
MKCVRKRTRGSRNFASFCYLRDVFPPPRFIVSHDDPGNAR